IQGRYEQDMKFEFDAAKEVSIVEVSTAITMAETLVYIRRSATKTKDKGKGIMEESESAMTKMKRQHEQERLGLARVEADKELTQRLQAEERDKYSGVDQVKMLVDLINQRKNHFAVKRAKERRNKPMTQAQQRTYMINYIKHMGSHTLQQLYDTCGVHHVSTEKEMDIFMMVEKEYPLSKGILTLMLVNKLLVDQYSKMANEILRKIFIQANSPRQ
nr:hypothetical protein [Tanacetum cinerariifolium]